MYLLIIAHGLSCKLCNFASEELFSVGFLYMLQFWKCSCGVILGLPLLCLKDKQFLDQLLYEFLGSGRSYHADCMRIPVHIFMPHRLEVEISHGYYFHHRSSYVAHFCA